MRIDPREVDRNKVIAPELYQPEQVSTLETAPETVERVAAVDGNVNGRAAVMADMGSQAVAQLVFDQAVAKLDQGAGLFNFKGDGVVAAKEAAEGGGIESLVKPFLELVPAQRFRALETQFRPEVAKALFQGAKLEKMRQLGGSEELIAAIASGNVSLEQAATGRRLLMMGWQKGDVTTDELTLDWGRELDSWLGAGSTDAVPAQATAMSAEGFRETINPSRRFNMDRMGLYLQQQGYGIAKKQELWADEVAVDPDDVGLEGRRSGEALKGAMDVYRPIGADDSGPTLVHLRGFSGGWAGDAPSEVGAGYMFFLAADSGLPASLLADSIVRQQSEGDVFATIRSRADVLRGLAAGEISLGRGAGGSGFRAALAEGAVVEGEARGRGRGPRLAREALDDAHHQRWLYRSVTGNFGKVDPEDVVDAGGAMADAQSGALLAQQAFVLDHNLATMRALITR